MDDNTIQGTLLAWRSLYCAPSFHFLPKKSTNQYMEVLQSDLRYLTEPDLMRAPRFIQTILEGLCSLNGQSHLIETSEGFADFVQKGKGSAQTLIRSLETLQKGQTGPLVVHLPYPVHFSTMAFYASELRALRRACPVELLTENTTRTSISQGNKCLMTID